MTNVLGIGSWDRSGSSIIARILGSTDGVVSVGEINNLWARGVTSNLKCGCGEDFAECPFWQEVISRAFSDTEGTALLNQAVAFAGSASNQRLLGMMLTKKVDRDFEDYVTALERLYPAILATSGADLIVDSSKIPWHLAAASRAAEQFRLVHLIRDPQGVVYSHQKEQAYQPERDDLMDQHGAGFTTAGWLYRNLILSGLWRSPDARMVITYEQFSATPQKVIDMILQFAGRPMTALPFTGDATVLLDTEHSVSGNPVRFGSGSVDIRLDSEWETKLKGSTRFAVGTATAPFRFWYQGRAASRVKSFGQT